MKAILFIIGYLICAFIALYYVEPYFGIIHEHQSDLPYMLEFSASLLLILQIILVVGMIIGFFIAYYIESNVPYLRKNFLLQFGSNLISCCLGNIIASPIGREEFGAYNWEWGGYWFDLKFCIFMWFIIPITGIVGGTILSVIAALLSPETISEEETKEYPP